MPCKLPPRPADPPAWLIMVGAWGWPGGDLPFRQRMSAAILGDGGVAKSRSSTGVRLPQVLGAFACGDWLALAGALMVLLRNPLADPCIAQHFRRAGVGAMVALLLGRRCAQRFATPQCVGAMLLVFGLAHGDGWTQTRLLLTGVIVASGCGAPGGGEPIIAPENRLRGMLPWLMGDLSRAGEPAAALAALPLRDAGHALRPRTQSTRPAAGQALGVAVVRLRRTVYFLASFATAVAVTTAGAIGFIGLVVSASGAAGHRVTATSACCFQPPPWPAASPRAGGRRGIVAPSNTRRRADRVGVPVFSLPADEAGEMTALLEACGLLGRCGRADGGAAPRSGAAAG